MELAESELIGLAPLAAFLAVADRAGSPVRGPDRAPAGGSRRLPPPARLLADAGPRAPSRSRAGQRTGTMSGSPFRLIHGGRSEEPTPGPADRRRVRGRDRRRRHPGGRAAGRCRSAVGRRGRWAGRTGRAGRRLLGGSDRRGRATGRARGRPRSGGLPARPVRADRRRRRHRHAGPRRPAHAPPVRGLARGRVGDAPARRRVSRDPRGRRRDPVDGRRDPRRLGRRADGPRPPLARRDARPRRDDDRGQVRLRPRPRDRDPPARGRPPARQGGPDRHRADLPRRARGPARVPVAPGGDGGVRPVGHRGAAPRRGRPRPGPVLRRLLRGRRVQRGPVAADPRGGRRVRDGSSGCTPTSSRHRAAPSWPPSSGRIPRTTWRRRPRPGSRRWPARQPRRRPRPMACARSWRRSCRRRPGS